MNLYTTPCVARTPERLIEPESSTWSCLRGSTMTRTVGGVSDASTPETTTRKKSGVLRARLTSELVRVMRSGSGPA